MVKEIRFTNAIKDPYVMFGFGGLVVLVAAILFVIYLLMNTKKGQELIKKFQK